MKVLGLGSKSSHSPRLSRLIQDGFTLQKQLSVLVCSILLAVSAWLLGQLVWIAQPVDQVIAPWKAMTSSSSRSESTSFDFSHLKNDNLFGVYNNTKPVVIEQPVIKDAPKTRLNLVLVGVVASSKPGAGLAVIANRGKQATYGIDEQVEGTRAKLKAVLVDRVIIDNSGRDETLMLEGLEYKKLNVSAPAQRTSSNVISNNPQNSEGKLAEIKATITKDPQQIFQYVRLSQVKRDGQVLGYRVSPGKEPELFKSVGLKSGDIATQLNGQDLTDPAAMGNIFRTISELSELSLTVERDGQQHDIYIEF